MKRYFKYQLLLSIMTLVLVNSCTDELGIDPFEDPVEKFLGTWRAEESSTVYGDGYIYTVNIRQNPANSSEILISNFYYQGESIEARALVTGNTITIMEQKICDDSIEIQGNGTYNSGVIYLDYTANDGADLDEVTAVYRRP